MGGGGGCNVNCPKACCCGRIVTAVRWYTVQREREFKVDFIDFNMFKEFIQTFYVMTFITVGTHTLHV